MRRSGEEDTRGGMREERRREWRQEEHERCYSDSHCCVCVCVCVCVCLCVHVEACDTFLCKWFKSVPAARRAVRQWQMQVTQADSAFSCFSPSQGVTERSRPATLSNLSLSLPLSLSFSLPPLPLSVSLSV